RLVVLLDRLEAAQFAPAGGVGGGSNDVRVSQRRYSASVVRIESADVLLSDFLEIRHMASPPIYRIPESVDPTATPDLTSPEPPHEGNALRLLARGVSYPERGVWGGRWATPTINHASPFYLDFHVSHESPASPV